MSLLIYALLFFLSGFAGLLYQIVWLHMAFTHFGIITPVLSVLVSVFMLGLGVGSWVAGRFVNRWVRSLRHDALYVYAGVEALTGLFAFAVPHCFDIGEALLFHGGDINSLRYLAASAGIIAASIFPACFCMGLTYPVMMAHLRRVRGAGETSFSFLYGANVLGAFLGAALTPFLLIELLGFQRTLWLGTDISLTVALLSLVIALRRPAVHAAADEAMQESGNGNVGLLWALGLTGFVSMAYEVLWTRAFTPALGTTVYAFAGIVAMYLASTWVGTCSYRAAVKKHQLLTLEHLWGLISIAAIFPVILTDPRIRASGWIILASIAPFCGYLGYLTPLLVDRYAQGGARQAGRAYAVNVAGSVFGPLFASYLMLPYFGAQRVMIGLAAPLLLLMGTQFDRKRPGSVAFAGVVIMCLAASLFCRSREALYAEMTGNPVEIRRDSTATVVSFGQGLNKNLLVNGIGITVLTPLTKMMAHMPILCHQGPAPQSALMICFGMGTTYRSLLSWGIRTTAVELVPSVRDAFGYYFADSSAVLSNPMGKIVIDDGRRYLKRTSERYDIITLDPPPPVEATGSGLLYSKEFYELVRAHLAHGGILQQWWPGGEVKILFAAARTLSAEFPYVRVYKGVGHVGFHFLASMTPIAPPTLSEALERLPPAVRQDIGEWTPGYDLKKLVSPMFAEEVPLSQVMRGHLAITDDEPANEYYFLRRFRDRRVHSYLRVS